VSPSLCQLRERVGGGLTKW